MARLKGILKIEGTIQDMTFYKTRDGHLVKSKSGVSKERIANDPAFVRTRENGAEFGSAAKAGKLLRNTLRTFMMSAKDSRVTSRLTQVMTLVKNYDTTSDRGQRSVAIGITNASALGLIKNFDFNEKAGLASVLYKPFTVDRTTGVITIVGLSPINDVAYPAGATDVIFKGAFASVDFTRGTSDITYTNEINIPLDSTPQNIVLTPASLPSGTGTKLVLLTIEFFQTINGLQYTLKNGTYNALAIVGAA